MHLQPASVPVPGLERSTRALFIGWRHLGHSRQRHPPWVVVALATARRAPSRSPKHAHCRHGMTQRPYRLPRITCTTPVGDGRTPKSGCAVRTRLSPRQILARHRDPPWTVVAWGDDAMHVFAPFLTHAHVRHLAPRAHLGLLHRRITYLPYVRRITYRVVVLSTCNSETCFMTESTTTGASSPLAITSNL